MEYILYTSVERVSILECDISWSRVDVYVCTMYYARLEQVQSIVEVCNIKKVLNKQPYAVNSYDIIHEGWRGNTNNKIHSRKKP